MADVNETTVVRIRRSKGEVVQDCTYYIGRRCNQGGWRLPPSPYQNPYPVKKYGLKESLDLYAKYLYSSSLIDRVEELRGHTLGCWCRPGVCHGDVLLIVLRRTRFVNQLKVLPTLDDVLDDIKRVNRSHFSGYYPSPE